MVDPKEVRTLAAADNGGVHVKNTINVKMEDLNEDDRKAVEQELEKEMAKIQRRKLTCFQKTCSGVIKKADTASVSGAKVNSALNPVDLVHMVDVSVASKYGDNLMQLIRVMAEDLHSTFDALKQDLSSSLPMVVRVVVQQINGEAQGKHVEVSLVIPNPSPTASMGVLGYDDQCQSA
jgi:hypothetical protein